MNVLMVDDEVGIREGMASFLRLAGHQVRTAETVENGVGLLDDEEFDVVVTDWHLGTEDATPVVAAASCPCVVVSGHPDEVPQEDCARVLSKPVFPADLLELIQDLAAPVADDVIMPEPSAALPADAEARVELVRALCGDVEVLDDGEFVTAIAPLPNEDVLEHLEKCGGDLRVIAPQGASRLEWRFFRDGRPDGVRHTVRHDEPWPDDAKGLAVDLHDSVCTPEEFLDLLDRTLSLRATGCDVWFLNVPQHLRLFVEALGRTEELPKRPMAGPRLPDVLTQLWS